MPITETAVWENDIYQIERTDPVEGGADGVSNRQAKQLTNRTGWLKQQVQDLMTWALGIDNFRDAITYRVTALEDVPPLILEPIKVGGLLLTTNNYADSDAVATGEGYGTWERLPGGFALTTIVPPSVPSQGIPPQLYDMLDTVGEYEHTLTINEMPTHHHLFGGSTGSGNDGGARDGTLTMDMSLNGGFDEAYDTVGTADNPYAYITSEAGDNQPFSIVQPSIVIGVWRRTA